MKVNIPVTLTVEFNLDFNDRTKEIIVNQVLKHHLYHALHMAQLEIERVSTESVMLGLEYDTGGQS